MRTTRASKVFLLPYARPSALGPSLAKAFAQPCQRSSCAEPPTPPRGGPSPPSPLALSTRPAVRPELSRRLASLPDPSRPPSPPSPLESPRRPCSHPSTLSRAAMWALSLRPSTRCSSTSASRPWTTLSPSACRRRSGSPRTSFRRLDPAESRRSVSRSSSVGPRS